MAVLGYLSKLKRHLGLVVCAHFLQDYSIEMFLIKYTISGQILNVSYLFSSQDTKQNMPLSFYLVSWWENQFIFKQSLKQGWQGAKEGKTEIQKFEYLENEKSFLD